MLCSAASNSTSLSFLFGRVPPDLRFRGPLEAKSFVLGAKLDPPGAQGRVFDLKCRSCGRDLLCITVSPLVRTPPKYLQHRQASNNFTFGLFWAGPEHGHEMCFHWVFGADLGAFCTIARGRLVGRSLRAKFGRNRSKIGRTKVIIIQVVVLATENSVALR